MQHINNIQILKSHKQIIATSILCRWSGRPAQRKPALVNDYNQHLRGVDRMDQMTAYYAFGRKSIKWWRKVFFWIVEVMVNNAHVLYMRHTSSRRKLSQMEFRRELAVSLCQELPARNSSTHHRRDDTLERLRGQHFPGKIPKRKDCRVCSQRGPGGERHLTNTACETCSDHPPLCIERCFKIYHTRVSL